MALQQEVSRPLPLVVVVVVVVIVVVVVVYSSNRECKPPPTPKFETKVIRDSNSDFRINLDPHVRRALSRRRQVWYKSAVDCMRIEKIEKC